MRTVTTRSGDEVSEADFDDYMPPAYRRAIARYPHCADPDHPGCPKCDGSEDDDLDPDDLDRGADDCFADDEPVPYTSNKEA